MKISFINEADMKEIIKRWDEIYHPFSVRALKKINEYLLLIKEAEKNQYVQPMDFSEAYKGMSFYTNQLPQFISRLQDAMVEPEFNLSNETIKRLHLISLEAKEWKRKYRRLKKEYDEEVLWQSIIKKPIKEEE